MRREVRTFHLADMSVKPTKAGKRIEKRIAQLERVFPRRVAEAIERRERISLAMRGLAAGANMATIARRVQMGRGQIRNFRKMRYLDKTEEPAELFLAGKWE